MRYWWLGLLLFLFSLRPMLVQAQEGPDTGQPAKSQASGPAVSGSELPPDAPLITISGLCNSGLASSTAPASTPVGSGPGKAIDPGCKTVITKAQYENLLGVLGARPSVYHGMEFARRYVELLLFSEKGRELGVEKDPKFQEKVRYSYLEALDHFTLERLQAQAEDISDAEVAKYYKEHPERFVQIRLLQIAVPKEKFHEDAEASPNGAATSAEEKSYMHGVALSIQKEAAAGVPPEKLQEKVYKIAGDPSVPETDLGEQVPDQIPIEYRKLIFDLKAGEVSQVTEDDHEYLIFKCAERHVIPPADAKKLVVWLRMRDSKGELRDSVKTQYNEQYFPKGAAPESTDSGEKTP
jgi:hypothetical protein